MGADGYISLVKSYVDLLSKSRSIYKTPGPVALDILEVFAHNESLSAYQVYSKLKSTRIKMAYKNVHKIIQRLLSLNLLIKAKKPRSYDNDHNAKYYMLSEYGIFRLFLTRHEGFLVNRLSFMSREHQTLEMSKGFIRYYHGCELFKTFILPLMQIGPLGLLNELFLVGIYEYLHLSCKAIESILQTEDPNIPVHSTIGSWYKMSKGGIVNIELLLSLREKFELQHIHIDEYINRTTIEVNTERKDVLEISNPKFKIKMYLDRNKKKAIATHIQSHRKHEYEIFDAGSDVLIQHIQSQIDWKVKIEFGGRKRLYPLVFQIVSTIGGILKDEQKSGIKELSTDKTFINLVDDMYGQFERGRSALLKL
jgi:hypothetical protein